MYICYVYVYVKFQYIDSYGRREAGDGREKLTASLQRCTEQVVHKLWTFGRNAADDEARGSIKMLKHIRLNEWSYISLSVPLAGTVLSTCVSVHISQVIAQTAREGVGSRRRAASPDDYENPSPVDTREYTQIIPDRRLGVICVWFSPSDWQSDCIVDATYAVQYTAWDQGNGRQRRNIIYIYIYDRFTPNQADESASVRGRKVRVSPIYITNEGNSLLYSIAEVTRLNRIQHPIYN